MVVTKRILTGGRVVGAVAVIKEHAPPTAALFEEVGAPAAPTNVLETKIWLRRCPRRSVHPFGEVSLCRNLFYLIVAFR